MEPFGRTKPEQLFDGLLIRTLVRVVSFGLLESFLFGTIGRFIYTLPSLATGQYPLPKDRAFLVASVA